MCLFAAYSAFVLLLVSVIIITYHLLSLYACYPQSVYMYVCVCVCVCVCDMFAHCCVATVFASLLQFQAKEFLSHLFKIV